MGMSVVSQLVDADLVSTGHFAQFQILNHLLNVISSALKELT